MNSGQWHYPRGVINPPRQIVLPSGPLQLHERGVWDPAAEYWGDPGDTIAASIVLSVAQTAIALRPTSPVEREALSDSIRE